MPNVGLYFHIHQPWRLRKMGVFDVGSKAEYFDTDQRADYDNGAVIRKIAAKSYRPMLNILCELLEQENDFHFALSVTGVVIEQLKLYAPEVVSLIQKATKSGRVDIIAETYYHSLASLYSPTEFMLQVSKQLRVIEDEFGVRPRIFRNTELIYTNKIAEIVKEAGFIGMLAEGAGKVLGWRSPTRLYEAPCGLPLLLKHYMLSDDIAFRFSESHRSNKPLTAETYAHWISSSYGGDDVVNLFMDFETFGEHQWEDTGIFDFFRAFVHRFIQTGNRFVPLREAITSRRPVGVYSSDEPVSWADVDRDITAWRGNTLQEDVLNQIYSIEPSVINSKDDRLIEDWRKLQISDHFYYMCTKWSKDGDVHAYFSPYGSPYNAYSNYNNALADLKLRIREYG